MRAVNLLPRDERRRKRVRMTIWVQLALVSPFVVGSLLGAGYLVTSSKVNDRRSTLEALRDELAALPPRVTPPAVDAQLTLQHEQRVSALALALRSRVAWDRILREISSILPEDVWLTTLSAQSPESAPVASTTPATGTGDGEASGVSTPAPAPALTSRALSLEGYTYSQEGVARFLSRLAVIPELTDVRLKRSELTTVLGRLVVGFSIDAGIRRQETS